MYSGLACLEGGVPALTSPAHRPKLRTGSHDDRGVNMTVTVKSIVSILPKRDSGDTLTPEEAKIVRRGEAQLRRGDSKPWRAVKHALAR